MAVVYILFTISILAAGFNPSLAGCPDEWVSFQNSCYYFGNSYKTWYAASAYCQSNQSELVEVNSLNETNFLVKHMTRYGCAFPREFWTDGTDMITDGRWIWAARQEPIQYFNWKHGEPNGQQNEDCISVNPRDGQWNDLGCYNTNFFVCEIRNVRESCEIQSAIIG